MKSSIPMTFTSMLSTDSKHSIELVALERIEGPKNHKRYYSMSAFIAKTAALPRQSLPRCGTPLIACEDRVRQENQPRMTCSVSS